MIPMRNSCSLYSLFRVYTVKDLIQKPLYYCYIPLNKVYIEHTKLSVDYE